MSIIKRAKSNFGIVPRQAMEDSNMSLKAKGLLAYLLCMPQDWQIYVTQLASVHKESKNTIAKIMNELIDFGYVVRQQRKDGHKFAGYDYKVYDVSQKDVSQKDVSQILGHVKLSTTNKDYTNKEYTNKEYSEPFEKFWLAFGKHGNKRKAFKAFSKLPEGDKRNATQGARDYSRWLKAKGDYKSPYHKHGSTYLSNRAWEDELPSLGKETKKPTYKAQTYYSQSNYNPHG